MIVIKHTTLWFRLRWLALDKELSTGVQIIVTITFPVHNMLGCSVWLSLFALLLHKQFSDTTPRGDNLRSTRARIVCVFSSGSSSSSFPFPTSQKHPQRKMMRMTPDCVMAKCILSIRNSGENAFKACDIGMPEEETLSRPAGDRDFVIGPVDKQLARTITNQSSLLCILFCLYLFWCFVECVSCSNTIYTCAICA